MILGASRFQVPLIRKAKNMGLTTIVASIDGDYPGFKEADISLRVNVTDREKILEKAQELQIDAIVTNQTDLPVTTVAYVAERMNLPGNGLACAQRFANKYLMRQAAAGCGFVSVSYQKVNTVAEAVEVAKSMRYPLIVKPVSSQGSRGVAKVRNEAELIERVRLAKQYDAQGEVIVEEYFEGREVTMDGLVLGSKFYNLPLGDTELFEIPDLSIAKAGLFPSTLDSELQQKVRNLNSKLVETLGLGFGLTHSEFRVCEQTGEVMLLEIAARGGGAYISSDVVPLACGLDVETILLRLSLGETPSESIALQQRAAGYYFIGNLPVGTVMEIRGLEEAKNIPGVQAMVSDLKIGSRISEMSDKTSRPAIFLLSGETRQGVDKAIGTLSKTVAIVVKTFNGVVTVGI